MADESDGEEKKKKKKSPGDFVKKKSVERYKERFGDVATKARFGSSNYTIGMRRGNTPSGISSKKEKLLVQLDQKLRDKEELLEKKNNFELKKYKSEDSGDGSGNSKLKIASIGGLIVVGAIVLVFLMGFLIQNWIIPAIIGGIIISAWWFRNMKYRDKARFGKFMIRVVIAIALVYVLYLLLWNTGVYESNIQPIINKIKDTTGATFSNIFSIFTNPEEQRGFGEFEDEELKKEGIGVEIKNFGADNRFNANHPIIVKGDLIVANLGEKESSANFNCEMEGYGSVNSLADEVKPETMIIPGYPEKSSEKITCIFEEGLNPEKKLDTREIKLIASFDEFYSTTDYELYFIHPSTYYELDRDGDGSPDDNPFKTYGWSMDHVNRITNVVGSVSSPGPVQVRVGTETPQPLKTDSEDLYFEVIVKSNEKANLKKVNELKIYIPSESIYIDEAESLFCEFEFLESSGKYNVYVPKESVYERLNEECVTKSCYQDKEKIIFGCYFSVNDFLDYGTQQDEIKVEMDYAFELISESSVTVRQSSD